KRLLTRGGDSGETLHIHPSIYAQISGDRALKGFMDWSVRVCTDFRIWSFEATLPDASDQREDPKWQRANRTSSSSCLTTSAASTSAATTTGSWAIARPTSTASPRKGPTSPTSMASKAAQPAALRLSPDSRRSARG